MALSTIPIPPDPKRDARARELMQTIHLWPVETLRRDWEAFKKGDQFFVTPNGYRVNAVACECPDYQLGENICKHVRAAAMYLDRHAGSSLTVADDLEHDARIDAERRANVVQGAAHAPRTATSWFYCSTGCGAMLPPEHLGRRCDPCFDKVSMILPGED